MADSPYRAGFLDHAFGRDPFAVALWYPTVADEKPVKYRGYPGSAARRAGIVPGTHPLIVISHGTLGHRFCHFWLAEFLVRKGFMVAAPQHPGDNVVDDSIARTPTSLASRPKHISDTLDLVLKDDTFGPHVDRARIGLLGHSVGGLTCLMLLGAEPDMGLVFDYCRDHVSDGRICERLNLDGDIPVLPDCTDDRFCAALIMMPAFGPALDEDNVIGVTAPVMVFSAPKDEVIPDTYHAQHMAKVLGARLSTYDKAGHYSSLPECTDSLAENFPYLCQDAGLDRADIHKRMKQEALDFFEEAFSSLS